MARYLIVANQTLGGAELDRTVRDRLERDPAGHFTIIVPMTAPKHESNIWAGGFDPYEGMTAYQLEEARRAMEEFERHRAEVLAEARLRAERRLGRMIEGIVSAGGIADGDVGDPDPLVAVESVLAAQSFDEVIVSTLPRRISRWLKMDLPSRVARLTDADVVTIEADTDADAGVDGADGSGP